VIERLLPHDKLVHNKPGRDEQLEDIKTLVRNMGIAKVKTLCYNWMPKDDWSRTSITEKERGGALVSEFDLDKIESEIKLGGQTETEKTITTKELWENLQYFLEKILPVCEEVGVDLALHPDDPPVPKFRGHDQIIYNVESLEKVTQLVKSPANGICFCQGTLASASPDIYLPDAIRRLSKQIKFVHFRDVKGAVPKFRETWQDNGKTNMWECMRTYYECGINVVMRPDHVPTMDGETNQNPGYEMLGRLFAMGYMRGLQYSIENELKLQLEPPQAKKAGVKRGRPKKGTSKKKNTGKPRGRKSTKKQKADDSTQDKDSTTDTQTET